MDEEKKEEGEDYPKRESEGNGEKPNEYSMKSQESLTDKLRKNPFIVSTLVCGILAVFLLIALVSGGALTGKVISEEKAGDYLVDYLSSAGFEGFEVGNVEYSDSVYLIETAYNGDDVPFYVTKAGYLIGNSLISIIPSSNSGPSAAGPSASSGNSGNSVDVPKSDKPKVELFVMTHCPYGTQAEKGMIPVFELLGDKIDGEIRFVHYFMHEQPGQEPDETPRQVCIREEQRSKWYEYLTCFLEDGDASRCLTEVGIASLDSCLGSDAEGYYAIDSDLSEGYGVQGSPTLVINGEVVSSARSPSAYLDTICQAFNDAPSECGESLSSASPSPGFGSGTGSDRGAQC